MGRYSKNNSTYTLRKRSQDINNGLITERDWSTVTGGYFRYSKGKRVIYSDSNFIFTTSNVQLPSKRNRPTDEAVELTYDNVKDSKNIVNDVSLNTESNDIRSFAYYGSCVELIESSISNIIATFPACIYITDDVLQYPVGDEFIDVTEEGDVTVEGVKYIIKDHKVTIGDKEYTIKDSRVIIDYPVENDKVTIESKEYTVNDNKITIEYTVVDGKVTIEGKEYTVVDGKVTIEGKEYTVNSNKITIVYPLTYDKVTIKYIIDKGKVTINGTEYTVVDGKVAIDGKEYTVKDSKVTIDGNEYTVVDGKTTIDGKEYTINECKVLYKLSNPFAINLLDEKEIFGENDNLMRYMRETFDDYIINDESINTYGVELFLDDCYEKNQWYYNDSDKKEQRYITKITINGTYIIYGYQVGKAIVYMSADNIIIKPKDEIIEEYFDSLTGFERQLLNRKSNPLYSNTFITPVEGNLLYKYVNRIYTWPTVCGYCPDIETAKYGSFIEKLLNMATIYDELWCDNLYGRMTHEAIKNFDWTYTRDYIDGEEQDNIDGGNMMQKILHLIGRIFDDIKCHVDGIKYSSNVSYNGFNNMPVALLSDKAEMLGWDTKSIIPPDVVDNNGIISLNEDNFINNNNIIWYNATNVDSVNTATTDIEFMKRLLLATKRIFSSKGTQESIEMVMALFGLGRDVDYTLTEQYYLAEAKEDTDNHLEDIYYEVNKKYSQYESGDYDNEITAFSNVTLNKISFNGNKYIIPFYNKNEIYSNEIYFQGKGGWGYSGAKDKKDKGFPHLETVSYLNVVADVESLTQVSPMEIKKGDIYYAVNLEDYPMNYSSDGNNVTHFFYFNSENYDTENYSSWTNITKDELDNRSTEEADKARYLYDIVNTNLGNNPHIGYGRYDNGQDYLNKMSKPFEYKLNHITNGEDNNNIADISEKTDFEFKIVPEEDDKTHNAISGNELINKITIDYTVVNNKVIINGKEYTVVDGKLANEYPVEDGKVTIGETEYTVEDGKVTINGVEYAVENDKVVIKYNVVDGKEYTIVEDKVTIDYTGVGGKVTINGVEYPVIEDKVTIDGTEYKVVDGKVTIGGSVYTVVDGKVTIDGTEYPVVYKVTVDGTEYIVEKGLKLNSKVFIIQNKIGNKYFKKYLKETIIPYVLQVIPSTTILKLENFN